MNDLTPEKLRSLLRYEPETGRLFWKDRPDDPAWTGRLAGKEAFTSVNTTGRLTTTIYRRTYKAHRVAWAIHYGVWPRMIDHINGDPKDNRIANLREATPRQNQYNRGGQSGFKGVCWHKRAQRWQAQIATPDGRKFLGMFDTEAEAAAAYDRAALLAHGEFARLNLRETAA